MVKHQSLIICAGSACAVLLSLCVILPADSTPENPPPFLSNFPQDLNGGRPYTNLPMQATLAQVDKTHPQRMIVLATQDRSGDILTCSGHVYVYGGDGTLRWEAPLPQPPGMGPSVADLNGDGISDVVVGYGEMKTGCPTGGGVRAFDGVDGHMLWDFATAPRNGKGSVYSTPAIADVNGDGQPEVVFGSWDQCIYLLDHNGQALWLIPHLNNECNNRGYLNGDVVSSSPALADLDADGQLEIVIGSSYNTTSGYLNVMRASDGAILARWTFDEPVSSSPAIADLNNDGVLDIVVGTGEDVNNHGRYVQSFHYDPKVNQVAYRLVTNWVGTTLGYVMSSPAIGDLNMDGILDVVAVAPNGNQLTTQGSTVYGWRGSDGTPLFSRALCDYVGILHYVNSSPVVADVAGDERPEIVLTQGSEVVILNSDGSYYTDQPTNSCGGQPSTTNVTYWTTSTLDFIPAVGPVGQTGDSAIIVAGAVNTDTLANHGRLFAWGGHKTGVSPWPQFHGDAAHTGLLDNVLPENPSGFNLTPPTNVLTAPQLVSISWITSGKDIGSGLAGYALLWDHNPMTLPDIEVTVPASATQVTKWLPGGSWYAHLQSVDRAGNRAIVALHFGPFTFYPNVTFTPLLLKE